MQLTGILRSWNDDRGFGFIAPTHGGAELFVHVTAFPRDGSRPVEGESLVYELGRGQNGKPQAVRVVRRAIGRPRTHPASVRRAAKGSPLRLVVIALLVLICIAYGYSRFVKLANSGARAPLAEAIPSHASTQGAYHCDGRRYCSQMTSCAEATYFLKNCPGVKMDGNNDGVPCEQQWCK